MQRKAGDTGEKCAADPDAVATCPIFMNASRH